MEPNQGGNNDFSNQRGNRTEKSRRVWTPKEEETLLAAMRELIAQGWKSDNGFRAGYLNKLEESFRNQLPGTDLRGNPHINSKLCMWKKNYNTLNLILNRSGVGFNLTGNFTVDCDEALWDSLIKVDGNAQKIRSKSWPFYYAWKEIFGKDRATGEGAEDIVDAVNELQREYSGIFEDYTNGDYHVNMDHIYPTESGDNSVCPSQHTVNSAKSHDNESFPENGNTSCGLSQQPDHVSKSKGKKRKASPEGIDKVCALLTEINRNNTAKWESMASSIGYEYELGQARMGIFDKLGNISGLSTSDKFIVSEILAKSRERLEIFLGLNESAKAEYVEHLLASKPK